MAYDPMRHRRRSQRLRGYDYAQAGAYFLTIVTRNRRRLLGQIAGGAVELSPIGQIVAEEWERTPAIRPNVELDTYVVMPDHMHMILVISWRSELAPPPPAGFQPASQTVGAIVRGFKGSVTSRAGEPIWQRDYHDRVIRSEASLNRIRRYIERNPLRADEG